MKTGNIGIRNLADIGVTNIDVYGTGRRRGTSSTTPKLLMFFRSEDQAKGLPKLDSSGVKGDSKYDQSFGFDMFNERLYGNNTDVYAYDKIERKKSDGTVLKDKYGNILYKYKLDGSDNKIEIVKPKLETFYDKEATLLTELKDSGTSFLIDYGYTLSKRNKKMTDINYYVPNVLLKPGKEVKLYAKFFDTDGSKGLNCTVYFKLSNNKGIDSFTPSIVFNKNEEVLEFKIKTRTSETIDVKTTLTAFVKDGTGKEIEIGKLNLLPNKLLQAKIFFIDVFYDTTTASTPFNGTNMVKDLNEKAFNQAAIEFISGSANKTLFLKKTDQKLEKGTYIGNTLSSMLTYDASIKMNVPSTSSVKLGDVLIVMASKFYEKIVDEIMLNIETELKKLDVNDGIANRKFVDPSSSIKTEIASLGTPSKTYEKIIDGLFLYLKDEFFINYIFAFICHNIEAQNARKTGIAFEEAVALLDAKEIIIPNNGIGKTMTLAHEIAHNLNIQHTFDKPATGEKGDIKIVQEQTIENIMDYPKNGDADRRNFITLQWNRMREKLVSGVNTIAELDVKKNTDSNNSLTDCHFSRNLAYFSRYLLEWLKMALEKKYNGNIDEIRKSQDNILVIFVNEITKILSKILSKI
ncbi:MAG: hypothetical protein EOO44_16285 [Flavobacterium sp.]|nr:MAG: hypothetical protein EOO44_16285 [Flavobacterium sp.]